MTTNALSEEDLRSGSKSAYFWLTFSCLAVAVLGFLPTYWLTLARGSLQAHPLIHMHAAAFYGWCGFLVFQAWLVMQGRTPAHREWGMAGISLATLVFVLGVLTAIHAGARGTAAGFGDGMRAFLIIPISSIVTFAAFVAVAIMNVRRPEAHRRYMLGATAIMLGAPVARWFLVLLAPPLAPGAVPPPPPVELAMLAGGIGLAPLLAALIVEWRGKGAPQRDTLGVLAVSVAVLLACAPISRTEAWQSVAGALIGLAG